MSAQYFCPSCKQQVERLQACGAVQYFCNHCNSLVSKSKVLTSADEETGQSEEA